MGENQALLIRVNWMGDKKMGMRAKVLCVLGMSLLSLVSLSGQCFSAKSMDYLGMEVGNRLEFNMSYQNRTAKATQVVSRLDTTTFSTPAFVVENQTPLGKSTSWYRKAPKRLALRKISESQGWMIFSTPLLVYKKNLKKDAQWVSRSAVNISGTSGRATLKARVPEQLILSTQAGAFNVYRLDFKLTVSAARTVSQSWTEWFAPYIGPVKSSYPDATFTLAEFAVGGGKVSTPPPILTEIRPAQGRHGSRITISGYNFDASKKSSALSLGGAEVGEIVSWSSKKIICLVPMDARSGRAVISKEAWKGGANDLFKLIQPNGIISGSPAADGVWQ